MSNFLMSADFILGNTVIKVFLKLSENKFVHRIFTKLPIAYQRRQQFNIINQQLKYEMDISENWN